jgi:hypothetical protein
MAENWEFHFRNFDPGEDWFGVYHAGCSGLGEDWHDGRPNCWGAYLPYNPTGGPYSDGNSLSVYQPASFVVNFDAWADALLAGLEAIAQFAIYVGSEGENAEALNQAIADAFNVGADVVKAKFGGTSSDTLQNALRQNFLQACQAINTNEPTVTNFANDMGLTSGWALMSGTWYQLAIRVDNPTYNNNMGWSVFRAPPSTTSSPNYIANHAFLNQGHLIYCWDKYTLAEWGGTANFWLPWS